MIDEEGNVEETQIARGHPLLTYAAEEAVKQWKYSPVLLEGTPIKFAATVTVKFLMGD